MTIEREEMYIYGILNLNTILHLSIPKDLLLEESEPRPSVQERGKSNGVVYTIPYQDISALVRDCEIVNTSTTLSINPERAKSLNSARDGSRDGEQVEPRVERIDYTHMRKDILARMLVGHQTVIERIMTAQGTIIPMRLGTFVQNETEVRDILSKGYNLIKEIFERISDKIEIDFVATWSDCNSIIKEAGEEKEIKEFKEKLLSNPKGITVDDQMKIGFMLKKALDGKREEVAKRIEERLKNLSEDTRTYELMDDNMVLNSAFLINKAKHKDFEIKVEELNIEFAEKLNFRCVGPLPPYSFYTLEVKKLKFEEIDWAKKKLGILNDITSKGGLKRAYQRHVFSTHPDKNPDNPCAEKEFDEVNKAYKILSDYCVVLEQSGQTDKIHLDEKEYKREALLVKVRE